MSESALLLLFWVLWLSDLGLALYGYSEFIMGLFGGYATSNFNYVVYWTVLLALGAIVLVGSLYLRQAGHIKSAVLLAAVPAAPTLLYLAWILTIVLASKGSPWR
jgi:hypothetical protein